MPLMVHMILVVFQACVHTVLICTCTTTSCLMGVLAGLATLEGAVLAEWGHTACSRHLASLHCPPVCMPEAVSPFLQMYDSYLRALLNDELPTITFKVDKDFHRGPKVGLGAVLAPIALSCLQHVVHVEQGSAWSFPVSLAQQVRSAVTLPCLSEVGAQGPQGCPHDTAWLGQDATCCVWPVTLPCAACRLTPSCGSPRTLRRLPEWLTGPTLPPQPGCLPVRRHLQQRQAQRCSRLRQSSRPCHSPAALSTMLLQLLTALLSSRLSACQPPQLWAVHRRRLQAG